MAPKKDSADTIYEVVHGIVHMTPVRNVGDQITESEFAGEGGQRLKKILLDDGLIRDTSAPLSPAAVGEKVADHLIELAQTVGLITNDGSTYSFAGSDYKGIDALRAVATVDVLKAAIAAGFTNAKPAKK
ncbi:MAG TPA: hypothetical protein VLC46_20255 [Thermoanaerobaculia bacterium]|jgi:hypothetical protein|nr:hypothetical protein [Thermoanaerobaculia bacterium]